MRCFGGTENDLFSANSEILLRKLKFSWRHRFTFCVQILRNRPPRSEWNDVLLRWQKVRKMPFGAIFPFPEIHSNLSGDCLCQSPVSKSNIAKWCCKLNMFLINNSPDRYAFNGMHYVQKKITCFWDGSYEYQWIRMKITDVITSRHLLIFSEISGKFPEIY